MKLKLVVLACVVTLAYSCGSEGKKEVKTSAPVEVKKEVVADADPMKDLGIGPVKSVTLGEIDEAMVAEGKALFKLKCSACHKISKRVVGPAMANVTKRRSPEWIMNMILNPEVMVEKNPIAKKLLAEYLAPMANQNLTEKEARLILEYFRTK